MTAIILFDGHCNLCSRSVQRLIQLDPHDRLRFASLQSAIGQHYLRAFGVPTDIDSFVMIDGGRAWLQSDAVLRIGQRLGGVWKPLATIARIVPPPVRNYMYAYLARHRYGWFGKTDSCWVPTPALQRRFLTDSVVPV
jgi:predicted DCC family thiol-disulfide oxidoreductase YuxK